MKKKTQHKKGTAGLGIKTDKESDKPKKKPSKRRKA